jgi:hypothetical protein
MALGKLGRQRNRLALLAIRQRAAKSNLLAIEGV